jgi:hypothetical protein
MKRWQSLALAGAALAAAACSDQPSAPSQSQQPAYTAGHPAFYDLFQSPGEHVHILPVNNAVSAPLFSQAANGNGKSKPGSGNSGTGIYYHGGQLILSPQIAAIYWSSRTIYSGGPAAGTAGAGSGDGSLVGLFMRSLGGTGYWNINNSYTNSAGQHVNNSLSYTRYWADNTGVPASGSSVSDAAVQAEVAKGFSSGALTFNASTLYVVFSDNGVNLGGGFGTQYCAYHGHFILNGNDVKYAVMPYTAKYPSACTAGTGISPSSDFAAAAEVNVLAHETEETASDEDLNAWFDMRGYENADKCAWNFGAVSSGSTGYYNQSMGGVHWLIQMNWVNAGSGGCIQHWP